MGLTPRSELELTACKESALILVPSLWSLLIFLNDSVSKILCCVPFEKNHFLFLVLHYTRKIKFYFKLNQAAILNQNTLSYVMH